MLIDLSIVIVTFNNENSIGACIQSIFDQTVGLTYEIIVIDNASSDKTELIVSEQFPSVLFIQTKANLGFAAAANIGLYKSRGQHIILLNPDTRLMNNALFLMLSFLCNHPEVGAVGGLLMQDEATSQRSYSLAFPSVAQAFFDATGLSRFFPGKVPTIGIIPDTDSLEVKKVAFIPGADLMFRRSELDKIGFLDERFFMFAEDSDWCFRLTKETAQAVFFLPTARIMHELGVSAGRRSVCRARMNLKSHFRFMKKNGGPFSVALARGTYFAIYAIKILLAWFRYFLQPKQRSYRKAEIRYFAEILKVSGLPDRMIPYL